MNITDLSKWLSWWTSTCDWNARMRALVYETASRAPNYRYYIGAGSRHTIWPYDKVYTDTKGGVPRMVDWVQAMRTGSPAWTNVECTDCTLLDGDPNPLQPPFNADGTVSCPAP